MNATLVAECIAASSAGAGAPAATACELADIFREYGQAYRETHRLTGAQRKAMRDIEHGRTAALGGQRQWCPECGYERYTYHSCRNRNCPKCQSLATAEWVAARCRELLPVPYFHEVLSEAAHRRHWLRKCGKRSWVVYSQAPFAGPRKLVDYLGRYTHRTALGNQRLVSCGEGRVTFRYRDRADGDREKLETLPAEEFLERFLQHVLPAGFWRVRHYGLLASRVKQDLLKRCRQLLGVSPWQRAKETRRTAAEWMRQLLGVELDQCPHCGHKLEREPLTRPWEPRDPTYRAERFPEFDAWNSS